MFEGHGSNPISEFTQQDNFYKDSFINTISSSSSEDLSFSLDNIVEVDKSKEEEKDGLLLSLSSDN